MLNINQSAEFHINMKQFHKNWKLFSDNVTYFENIVATKGRFFCIARADVYEDWLNEFGIFYTKTLCKNRLTSA